MEQDAVLVNGAISEKPQPEKVFGILWLDVWHIKWYENICWDCERSRDRQTSVMTDSLCNAWRCWEWKVVIFDWWSGFQYLGSLTWLAREMLIGSKVKRVLEPRDGVKMVVKKWSLLEGCHEATVSRTLVEDKMMWDARIIWRIMFENSLRLW